MGASCEVVHQPSDLAKLCIWNSDTAEGIMNQPPCVNPFMDPGCILDSSDAPVYITKDVCMSDACPAQKACLGGLIFSTAIL